MSLAWFFDDGDKRRIKDAVAKIEACTTAEVVVSVQRVSGQYRHADYLGGFVLALAVVAGFLYHPEPFDHTYFPLEQAAAFALGAIATNAVAPLRRLFIGSETLREAVRTRARAAFVELGIGKSPARNGVLVFVSTFEGTLEVVSDIGIDANALGAPWADATKKLERAVRRDRDLERFLAALDELGASLSKAFPRTPAPVDGDESEDEPLSRESDA